MSGVDDDAAVLEMALGVAAPGEPVVRVRHVREVVALALTGGSGDWIDRVEMVNVQRVADGATWGDEVARGGAIRVVPRDAPEDAREIDIRDVERGLRMALRDGMIADVEEMDAADADVALQLAMWRRVVFG